MRARAALLAALAALLVVTPSGPAQAIGEPTVTNPLVADGADPWVTFVDGNYYSATTTWSSRIEMRKAPTLAGLKTAPVHVVWSDTDPARCCNFWAFEFHRLQGPSGWRWYLMYTAGNSGNLDGQRLHVLESAGDDPLGPYAYKGMPLPPQTWNIDGTYLRLGGELFLVWSAFDAGVQSNWIARMSNPWTVTGPTRVLSRPTHAWETSGNPVHEGPVALQRGGRTFIVYSASACVTPDYKLGMLTYLGGDPVLASSWSKGADPVFSAANGVYGPGHNGFFTSPDGTESWIAYHGNAAPDDGCGRKRSLRAQKFTWRADGTPSFGSPVAAGTALAVPSGERGPITAAVRGAGYELVNRNSGLCAVSLSTVDGADVRQGACGGGAAEWVLDPTADGYLRLVNRASGKVLDSADCGTANGTDARQWAWLANPCQQWSALPTGDGYTRLVNRANGNVLDATNCGTGDVRQWTWLDNACQRWDLRPVGALALTSADSGKAVDVTDCAPESGTIVRQWRWIGSPCQRWTFRPLGAGQFELRPASAPAACLRVAGGSAADGARIEQGQCGQTGARWRVEPSADGTARLVAAHSGKALTLVGCGLADGAALAQGGSGCGRFRLASS